MTKQTARYLFALDDNNCLININDTNETNNSFVCPCCKSEMIKRCGKYRAWHFAHKNKQCDYNKYLHTVAEQRIMEWFNTSSGVMINIRSFSKCKNTDQCKWHYGDTFEEDLCKKEIVNRYNLKKWFSHAALEKSYVKNEHKFIADIFCQNRNTEGEPLFIEICVTHPCEQEKIDSGIRIIEIDINSEADIDSFISSPIEENEYIRFYNFHPKESISNESYKGKVLKKIVLLPSMKTPFYYLACSEIEKRKGIFEITADDFELEHYFFDVDGFYHVAIAVASQYFQFKSCYLCKYHNFNDWYGGYICVLYKKFGKERFCRDNDPRNCSNFQIDQEAVKKRIKALNEYMKTHPVDIWMSPSQISTDDLSTSK